MGHEGPSQSRLSRADAPREARLCAALTALLLLVYTAACLFVWAGSSWWPEWDSALYLLLGSALEQGQGHVWQDRPFFLRPPGFAWLLSLFADQGVYDHALLNRLIMASAATTVAAIVYWLRPLFGGWRALAVALLVGTGSFFAGSFNWVASDFPFLTLLFLGLGLLQRAQGAQRSWWLHSLAGVLVLGAAYHLRSVALALAPCLLFLRRQDSAASYSRRAILPILLLPTLALPWMFWSQQAIRTAPAPSEQLLLFDYATALRHTDPGDPGSPRVRYGEYWERIQTHAAELLPDLAGATLHSRDSWAVALLLGLVLGGWGYCMLRRRSPLDAFAPGYALLILAYFTYDRRLVLPLAVFVTTYFVIALAGIARAAASALRLPNLRSALPTAVVVGLLAANLREIDKPQSLRPNLRLEPLADWIRQNTAEEAVLLCEQAPILEHLSGRRCYTYRFHRGSDLITKHGIDHVIGGSRLPKDLKQRVERLAREQWTVAGRRVYRLR